MWYVLGTIAIVLLSYMLWRFARFRYFTFSPITIAGDDPFLFQAYLKARADVERFKAFFAERPHACTVKIPFRTDQGAVEHLWGEPKEVTEESVRVALVNRPVSQVGSVPTEINVPLNEISDWQVL